MTKKKRWAIALLVFAAGFLIAQGLGFVFVPYWFRSAPSMTMEAARHALTAFSVGLGALFAYLWLTKTER